MTSSPANTDSPSSTISQRVLRGGFVYVIATAINGVTFVVLFPALSRMVTIEEVGLASIGIATMQGSALVWSGGISAALVLGDASRRLTADRVAGVLTGTLLWATGGSGALLVIWYTLYPNRESAVLLGLVGGAFLSQIQCAQAIYRSRRERGRYVASVLGASLGGGMVGLLSLQIAATASALLVGWSIVLAVLAVCVTADTGWSRPHLPSIRWCLKIGLPTLPHQAGRFASRSGDRFIIASVLGNTLLGLYEPLYLLGSIPLLVIGALNQGWSPDIYRMPPEDRAEGLADSSLALFEFLIFLHVGFALLAPLTIPILVPDGVGSLAEKTSIVLVVSFVSWFQLFYFGRSSVLFLAERTHTMLWISGPSAAVGLLAAWKLTQRYGLMGAAAATLLGYGVGSIFVSVIARSHLQVAWHTWREGLLMLVSAVLTSATLLLPFGGSPGLILRLVLAFFVGVIMVLHLVRHGRIGPTAVARSEVLWDKN